MSTKKSYRECPKSYYLPVEKENLDEALKKLREDHPEIYIKDENGNEYCEIMKTRSRFGYYVMKKPTHKPKKIKTSDLLAIDYKKDPLIFEKMKDYFAKLAKDPKCSLNNPEFYNDLKSKPNFLENLYKDIDKTKESIERKIKTEEAIYQAIYKVNHENIDTNEN